jgi:ferredoxin
MPYKIIAENCTGCMACEFRCPTNAISGLKGEAFIIEAESCIDCGACGVICPDDAILDTFGNMTAVLKRVERPIAVVNLDNCNGCGVCIDVCPFDALFPAPENTGPIYLGLVEVDENKCVGCKLCEEVCGWEGIYIMTGTEKIDYVQQFRGER